MAKRRHSIGLALATLLGMTSLLHAYWGIGGTWGLSQALGGPDTPIPPPWAMWLVATLLVAAALVVLGRLGIWGQRLPRWIFIAGIWGLVAALLMAAFLNLRAVTVWERFVFAPFSLVLALGAAYVAGGPQRDA